MIYASAAMRINLEVHEEISHLIYLPSSFIMEAAGIAHRPAGLRCEVLKRLCVSPA